MSFSAAVFDLDGTLIDSSEGILRAVNDTIDILGFEKLDPDFIRSCIGPPIGDSIGSKVGYTQDEIKSFYEVFRPVYKDKYLMECHVYPGIPSVLDTLRNNGVKLGIATNKREDYTATLLESIGLSRYFDSVCAMDMEGRLKKPDILEKCIRSLGVPSENVVMIGDASSDLDAAVKCDVEFIGVGYGFGFRSTDDVPSRFRFSENVEQLTGIILNG